MVSWAWMLPGRESRPEAGLDVMPMLCPFMACCVRTPLRASLARATRL